MTGYEAFIFQTRNGNWAARVSFETHKFYVRPTGADGYYSHNQALEAVGRVILRNRIDLLRVAHLVEIDL